MTNVRTYLETKTGKPFEQLSKEEMELVLQQLLNDNETFGLQWKDMKEEAEELLATHNAVLEEVPDKEIATDPRFPTNLLIEGESLHALKALRQTHRDAVDVVWINPPHNTGNKDFRFNGRFVKASDKRRHDKWASFMEKRLRLARDLMNEEGVIFICINDNEEASAKLLCNRIFGEGNFISRMIWKQIPGNRNMLNFVSNNYEYVLVYRKSPFLTSFPKQPAHIKNFPYVDENGEKYQEKHPLDSQYHTYSKNLDYPITAPDGEIIYAGRVKREEYLDRIHDGAKEKDWAWNCTEEEFKERLRTKRLVFRRGRKNEWMVYKRLYYKDATGVVMSNYYGSETTQDASNQMARLFDKKNPYRFAKPMGLIQHCIRMAKGDQSDITILDFFGTSASLGHAVLEMNKEDGGNRNFILISHNYDELCENVTYKRLKKAIHGYKTPSKESVLALDGNLKYYKVGLVEKEV